MDIGCPFEKFRFLGFFREYQIESFDFPKVFLHIPLEWIGNFPEKQDVDRFHMRSPNFS
jgi:hypothetical protein